MKVEKCDMISVWVYGKDWKEYQKWLQPKFGKLVNGMVLIAIEEMVGEKLNGNY